MFYANLQVKELKVKNTCGFHKLGTSLLVLLKSCRDILLLETGFLTILLAPLRSGASGSHDGLMMWLLRWLLFRLMFASGIVKLTSQCPTWWGLTGE